MATQHDRQQAHLHGAGTLASASYGLWRYPDRARINPQDVTGGSTWHSVIQKIKVLFGGAPKPALARALLNKMLHQQLHQHQIERAEALFGVLRWSRLSHKTWLHQLQPLEEPSQAGP